LSGQIHEINQPAYLKEIKPLVPWFELPSRFISRTASWPIAVRP
jgi:hypothetical protein